MVVEIDRKSDILLQERLPEIPDTSLGNLVDVEMIIELFLRTVAAVCRVQRAEVVIHLSWASGIIIVIDVDVVSVIFNLII